MDGDKLARGYRGPVTYRVPKNFVDDSAKQDFTTMDEGEFRKHYLVSAKEYAKIKKTGKFPSNLVKVHGTVAVDDEKPTSEIKVEDKRAFTADGEAKNPVPKKPRLTVFPKPLGDKVLLRREEQQAYSEGGLYIEGISQVKPSKCQVLSLSERPSDKYAEAALATLKAGDWVWIAQQVGDEITLDDDTPAVVVHVFDVLLVL